MARRAAQRADRAALEAGDDPSRPDNIPPQEGDDPGAVIDINTAEEEVDVNSQRDNDDVRPDAEKEAERAQREEAEAIRARQTENEDPENEDGERRPRRRTRGRRLSDDELSRDMSRRVNRERELRRQSEERVDNVTAENQRLKDRIAKIERAGTGTAEIESSLKDLKAKLESLKKDIAEAIEAGNTTKQLDLQIQMGEVQGRILLAERDLESARKRSTETDDANDGQQERTQTQQQPQIVKDWLAANRKWWNLPSAKQLREASIVIDKQIREEIKDGDLDFTEYSEDHMDELSARLLEESERLDLNFQIKDFNGEDFTLDEEEEEEREPAADRGRKEGRDVERRSARGGRSPQGGMGGREGRRKAPTELELARQGKVRLGDADYAQMRAYKLDPNDPNVRKRFAKERIRTILTDARKGGDR